MRAKGSDERTRDGTKRTTGGMSGAEDRRGFADTTAKTGELRKLGEDDGAAGNCAMEPNPLTPGASGCIIQKSKREAHASRSSLTSHLNCDPQKGRLGVSTDQWGESSTKNMCPYDRLLAGSSRPSGGVILGQAHFRGTRHSVDRMDSGQKVRKRARKEPSLHTWCWYGTGVKQGLVFVSVHEVLPHK